jgi:hypothetical protein
MRRYYPSGVGAHHFYCSLGQVGLALIRTCVGGCMARGYGFASVVVLSLGVFIGDCVAGAAVESMPKSLVVPEQGERPSDTRPAMTQVAQSSPCWCSHPRLATQCSTRSSCREVGGRCGTTCSKSELGRRSRFSAETPLEPQRSFPAETPMPSARSSRPGSGYDCRNDGNMPGWCHRGDPRFPYGCGGRGRNSVRADC